MSTDGAALPLEQVLRGVQISVREYQHEQHGPSEGAYRESAIAWLREALDRLEALEGLVGSL